MALAKFHSRAALAASHAVQGLDAEAVAQELESAPVAVAFDASAGASAEGRSTLHLAVNLLARLYPRLAIVPLGARARPFRKELAALARAINPDIELSQTVKGASACVTVGSTSPAEGTRCIHVGSDGWLARLSATGPVGSGRTDNPFAAAAAACLAAANVFRLTFAARLPHGGPDGEVALSLLDYRAGGGSGTKLGPVDIGEAHLVGLGAIGNGAVWALSRVPGLRGTLHMVDHQPVELSNLQRYVLAGQEQLGAPKVRVAASRFGQKGLSVGLHALTWSAYVAGRPDQRLDRVLVALDSAADRIAVQASLPRRILNAWTQPGDLGVSRHDFLGDGACLACLYLPRGKEPDLRDLVAAAIGLPEEKKLVGELLYHSTPVGRDLLERIAAAKGIPLEALLPFESKPMGAFYADVVCGSVLFRRPADGHAPRGAEVPMPFQSAMAGVLLGAELVIEAAELRKAPVPATTRINLLRPLAPQVLVPERKGPGGRCICQDPDYVAAYQRKYPGTGGVGMNGPSTDLHNRERAARRTSS